MADVQADKAEAARLEAEGRHLDALNLLSRAANAGDPEALRRVGLKLLTGKDAPYRPADGARLLSDAVAGGDAQAAAQLSVLAAGGLHGPQSWTAALDYLQRAAELGSRSTQAQLAVLAGEASAPSDRAAWSRLRSRIDLGRWTSPAPLQSLNEAPLVRIGPGLVPPAVCDLIVAQAAGGLVRAEVHDPRTGLTIMGATRTNRVANFGLTETTLLNLLVQARIGASVRAPLRRMEAFAVLNYAPGEEASDHVDYLDPAEPAYAEEIARLGQRVMTCLVYLNEDYEGGETAFPELGLAHRGRKGDALVFMSVDGRGAPDPRSVHAGRPPTSGEKWVLSQFIRDKEMI